MMEPDPPPAASSAIVKHSLAIAGHRTSISLEYAFWDGLKTIAVERGLSLASLVAAIDAERGAANLSSAIRVFVLNWARSRK
ncbi:ribbon-helix-helix domain-containing protein [Methylocapsa acidiphila]|uniref:ribbon-helix-helix domain-containing protein n=1 Tax=Methylocapsa acidiphila TaxID=133552 RepID=UPI000479F3DF|nr:ribbon-helix-helix domain-containing protein [Methylocapsa acidiphila]